MTGGRAADTDARRRSTASKIIIGREEIDRFGDSTVGEVLKRLPGVTLQGAPGRGGAIRMRGLGSGYTQMLLDGQRVPPGFSLDSLTPDQIERIEILRAPTAETGARAIAGTINIVTREGYRKRLNDLRAGVALESGHWSPGISWTRNEPLGDWIVNTSLSAFRQRRESEVDVRTVDTGPVDPALWLDQREQSRTEESRTGLHLASRLQWRGEGGESLVLSPFVVLSQGHTARAATLVQSSPAAALAPPLYDHSSTAGDSRLANLRLNSQWNHRFADARWEWHAGIGRSQSDSSSRRAEFAAAADAQPVRRVDDDTHVVDDSASLSMKWLRQWAGDHSLTAGAELEGTRRRETRTTTETSAALGTRTLLGDFGDNLGASSGRTAAYAQDEWNLTPNWAAYAGLRWEAIGTRSSGDPSGEVRNRSAVWTPLAHAVWKPDPKGRDQVRFSLTRSYRSPTLGNLVSRPSISSRYPVDGPPQSPDGETNRRTSPDRAGNPSLKPELATGIDVALERYLPGGGLLSANVFRRRIRDLIRTLTSLEDPSWGQGRPRWVARPQNIGAAVTEGVELEAKFRASDLWEAAPPVDLRSNLSLFRSRVSSVPGPDNRLDQQPGATANLGFDWRLRWAPVTLGANLNWNPDYTTRLSEDQWAYQGPKRVLDAYVLWTVQPGLQLRLSGSNLGAGDYVTAGTVGSETSTATTRSTVNWQLRIEAKL